MTVGEMRSCTEESSKFRSEIICSFIPVPSCDFSISCFCSTFRSFRRELRRRFNSVFSLARAKTLSGNFEDDFVLLDSLDFILFSVPSSSLSSLVELVEDASVKGNVSRRPRSSIMSSES